jgi:cytochrome c peroxidase
VTAFANEFTWGYLPSPLIPADNPLTPAKVQLGQRLFTETALSVTDAYSCGSCHRPQHHFTDGLPRAVGATGEQHPRNTPTLYNVAYNASFGWLDEGLTQLEAQHLVPLFNNAPLEMGFDDSRLRVLATDPTYVTQFATAFTDGVISTENVTKALASYVRTLIAPVSAFDRYLFEDDSTALSASAIAGLELFFSPRLGCAQCHASFNLSGPISHQLQASEPVFHVTGVGSTNIAFRAPTLRMVKHTAPYMHDGSLATLYEVVQHYQQVRVERIPVFDLSAAEQRQLIAFLESL